MDGATREGDGRRVEEHPDRPVVDHVVRARRIHALGVDLPFPHLAAEISDVDDVRVPIPVGIQDGGATRNRVLHLCQGGVGGIEFNLPISSWLRLFRDTGFEVLDYHELQAPEGSEDRHGVPGKWAQRWPAEHVWKLRRR